MSVQHKVIFRDEINGQPELVRLADEMIRTVTDDGAGAEVLQQHFDELKELLEKNGIDKTPAAIIDPMGFSLLQTLTFSEQSTDAMGMFVGVQSAFDPANANANSNEITAARNNQLSKMQFLNGKLSEAGFTSEERAALSDLENRIFLKCSHQPDNKTAVTNLIADEKERGVQ